MDTLNLTTQGPHAGTYQVRSEVDHLVEKARLKEDLYQKQRLYPQLLKQGSATAANKQRLAEEISDINIKLHSHVKS